MDGVQLGDANPLKCFYGEPGDRLWVREAHAILKGTPQQFSSICETVYYREDKSYKVFSASGKAQPTQGENVKWRPSIHMPRWASRITLEITDVRVERVQDIAVMDCRAEGVQAVPHGYKPEFMALWNSINEKRGYGWDANPWVWVVEFRVVNQADTEATDE